MRLTIKDEDDQSYTMVEIMVLEWDGKSDHFRIFCADGDDAKIGLSSPSTVQNVISSLKVIGNAEIEGYISWNEDESEESDEENEEGGMHG